MSYSMIVNVPEQGPLEIKLNDGRYRLGSNHDCEIHVNFEEVGNLAAQIEVRGGAVFIRNMNPYAIFVGEQELGSSQQGEWPVGHVVSLTQSVTLELLDSTEIASDAAAADSAKRSRSSMQIAVVVVCLAMGYFLLSTESSAPDSTKRLSYNFTDLVQELEMNKQAQATTVLNYMIDARVADARWGSEDPQRAIQAYQLLLDEPSIREASLDDSNTESRIRRFALARLDDLSAIVKRR